MKNKNLHNIKTNGFRVPKDYFDSVENNIISDLKLKELNNNFSGFNLPTHYFDTLENNILNKISEEKTPKVIRLFTKKSIIYISGIAAAILLMFNLSIFDRKLTLDSFDSETVEDYILNENIESYEIAELLSEEDFLGDHFIEYNIDEQTVETYILDNLDIEDLY